MGCYIKIKLDYINKYYEYFKYLIDAISIKIIYPYIQ